MNFCFSVSSDKKQMSLKCPKNNLFSTDHLKVIMVREYYLKKSPFDKPSLYNFELKIAKNLYKLLRSLTNLPKVTQGGH